LANSHFGVGSGRPDDFSFNDGVPPRIEGNNFWGNFGTVPVGIALDGIYNQDKERLCH
jgi:hypothetical protein